MFKPTTAKTVKEYIAMVPDERRSDIQRLHELIRKTAPGLAPHLQAGMIGYGSYHYRYASGREGDWPVIALANQKNYISLYVMAIYADGYAAESFKERLPKADIGRSCVRFRRLDDLDPSALRDLLRVGARFRGVDLSKATRPAKR